MRRSLVERARAAKADWVLCVGSDERLERNPGDRIRRLTKTQDNVVYGFPFLELFTQTAFRTGWSLGAKKEMGSFSAQDWSGVHEPAFALRLGASKP